MASKSLRKVKKKQKLVLTQ